MSQKNFKDALTKIHELAELLGLDYRLLIARISEVEKVSGDFNDIQSLKKELSDILKSSTLRAGCQIDSQLSSVIKAEFLLDSEISEKEQNGETNTTCLADAKNDNENACNNPHNLGFSNACLPQLTPLLHSAWHTEYDKQLGKLFVRLFYNCLALKSFDINNLGNAQLGTFNLIRYISNSDGLAFIKAPQLKEVNATRYLYKAWKNKSHSHRGLFFYRLYLKLQFGDLAKAHQMWQPLIFANNYPAGLLKKSQKEYKQANFGAANDIAFPTSRVRVEIEREAIEDGREKETAELVKTVSESVLPARLIPSMSIYSAGEATRFRTGSDVHSAGNEKIAKDLLHHESNVRKEINTLSALADTRIESRNRETLNHQNFFSGKTKTASVAFSLSTEKKSKDVLAVFSSAFSEALTKASGFTLFIEAA